MAKILYYCVVFLFWSGFCDGWRAVPANEAMYALRSVDAGIEPDDAGSLADNLLPRDSLHSTYKFGYCTAEATKRQYLRTSLNISFVDKADSLTHYIYVIANMNTQRFSLECIVMKFFTPQKFRFWKSRIPLYYCQGQVFVHMMNTVQRLALHEFFLNRQLNMAVDIRLEFYHPAFL